ncbi:hypothetical protein COLO4_10628 [Corchorus olitorius]|uniref:Aminotransferase-like plant mobile domain-containing protein n=1 Tax=Corchorus olitorius TaxID=93759 RepID=A0A1R3K7P4_9ROSI|nr:hypothetical protein COLO4_10628 [Corchorus olitorius]
MAKFSGEGGAKQYSARDARVAVYNGLTWGAIPFTRNRELTIVDDGTLDQRDFAYLVSVRSSYLAVRCNGNIIVEPYSPHRFGRQFGFCQGIPGTLNKDVRSGSEADLVFSWRICNAYNTKFKLICPPLSLKIADLTASGFAEWWSKVHIIDDFDQYIDLLISSTRVTKKVKQRKEVVDTQLSSVQHGKGKVLVIGPSNDKEERTSKRKPTELTQEVLGTLETQRVVSGNNTMTVDNVSDETDKERHWKRTKTTKLRSHDLTVELFGDSSPAAQRSLDMPGMGETCENNVVKPHSKALPLSAPEFTKLDADKVIEDGQLQLALILWENVQLKIARTPFNQVHLLIEEVEKEISALQEKKAKLESSLKENEKALEVIRTDVSHIQEEMASAESRPILSEADANALKVLEDLLKSSREDLKNLKWKP